jgi:hypothetical protein
VAIDDRRMQRAVSLDADACEVRPLFARPIFVQKCEWRAGAILTERVRADAPHFFLISRFSRSRRQITEDLPASILDDPFRHVEGSGQHATDLAVIVRNRAV